MECRQVRERIPDFLDDTLERAVRERFTDHLSSCETCKAEVRSLQAFITRLDTLPLEPPPSGTKSVVMDALVREGKAATSSWGSLAALLNAR